MSGRCSSSGRESTRRLIVTICRSFVPVADEMLRGRIRTSNWCGVCTHGMRKCVPSPRTARCTPLRRSNITARKPPSTLYTDAWKSETPAPMPTAARANPLRACWAMVF